MFEIKVEAQFKADYKRTMRIHPQLKSEFKAAVAELVAHGLSLIHISEPTRRS